MSFLNSKVLTILTAFFGCFALQITTGITVRNILTVVLFVCIFKAKEYIDRYEYRGKQKPALVLLYCGI